MTKTTTPKLPIREALAIVRALKKAPLSSEQLKKVAGVSQATFFRLLLGLRDELGVDIAFDEKAGGYVINDYGLLNRRAL